MPPMSLLVRRYMCTNCGLWFFKYTCLLVAISQRIKYTIFLDDRINCLTQKWHSAQFQFFIYGTSITSPGRSTRIFFKRSLKPRAENLLLPKIHFFYNVYDSILIPKLELGTDEINVETFSFFKGQLFITFFDIFLIFILYIFQNQ